MWRTLGGHGYVLLRLENDASPVPTVRQKWFADSNTLSTPAALRSTQAAGYEEPTTTPSLRRWVLEKALPCLIFSYAAAVSLRHRSRAGSNEGVCCTPESNMTATASPGQYVS